MNRKIGILALTTSFAGLTGAFGQGLLSIGAYNDEFENLPFTTTVTGALGWDSNVGSRSVDEVDSMFYQVGASAGYSNGNRATKYNIGALFNATYYDKVPTGDENWFYNARITGAISHRVNSRLTISDRAYFSYEFEPDYAIGASTSRRDDQYTYFYNNLSASYKWTRRFSTIFSWTASAIDYEENTLDAEDRWSNIFALQFAYALDRLTSLNLEYRFNITEYDATGFNDFQSQYVLVGVDRSFSPTLTGSLRGGVEYRDYDNRSDYTRPYVEGALNYRATDITYFRWYVRYGMESNELGSFEENIGLRTGISANHYFAKDLSGNVGVHYVHSDFRDSPVAPDFSEDLISLSVGLNYRFYHNMALYTNYIFTGVYSDREFREYDRHRVTLGVSATF